MTYSVIYDGDCHLCVTLVQVLERLDRGQQFRFAPMQDQTACDRLGVTPADCELGMVMVQDDDPSQRWQGSAAAEEIGRRLPGGEAIVSAYRSLPGLQQAGDRLYEQVRDRRYQLFGRRDRTYTSPYPLCGSDPHRLKRRRNLWLYKTTCSSRLAPATVVVVSLPALLVSSAKGTDLINHRHPPKWERYMQKT
ncbi:thiol-disulfide oxidoreductase DCC family protein [Trichothermofontia sp.]